ncbi:MAG: hypothetical protein M3220_11380 [Chloroflexota bacterium]|nr:hypothetical protein [Chloroflexota bacterium]
MIRRALLVLFLVPLLLGGCGQAGVLQVEMPDDGPPVPVSQEAAVGFIRKSTTAAQSAANTGSATITITEGEVTSFLAVGIELAEKLQEVQNLENLENVSLQDLERLEGIAGIEGLGNIEELQRVREEREQLPNLPDLQLPDLSLRMTIKEPQVRFQDNGHITVRGYGELRGRRQPIRIVTAPHASQGELVLDFVEGNLGPVPIPGTVFDLIGSGIARAILAGQEYGEITEISVGDGVMTISGRRN